MLKTISPIDNSIYVERAYASSSEIENTLKLSEQSKLIWKNTSLDERKKLVSKFVECFLSNNKEIEEELCKQEDLYLNVEEKCEVLRKELNI